MLTTTSNIIIDGSNTPGAQTRNLRFTNVRVDSAAVPSILLRVVGACDNVQFKNLYVDNVTTATNKDVGGIEFTTRHTSKDGDWAPQNGLVDNCAITCLYANSGGNRGITCRVSNTPAVGVVQANMRFTNNEIVAGYQCIELGNNSGAEILNNTFVCQFDATVSGIRSEVVRHNSANGTGGWTTNIIGNKWLYTRGTTLSTGPGLNNCLNVGAGVKAPLSATYNIYNNTFGGFDCSGVVVNDATHGPVGGLYHCFVVGSADLSATINFCHNSINMPNFAGMTSPNLWERYGAVALSATNFNGTLNLKNNVIRMEQNNGALIFRTTGGTGTINADYNSYWIGSAGARLASVGLANGAAPNFPTLTEWQAAGYDRHSTLVNPTVANNSRPGKWVSNSDLHFDAQPSDSFSCVALAAVTTDIDGEARAGQVAYKGADERTEALGAPVSAARDWSLFE